MKKICISLIPILLFILPATSDGYILPEYQISKKEMKMPAREVFSHYELKLKEIASNGSITKIKSYEKNPKIRLSLKERKLIPKYRAIQTPLRFWKYVVDLKKSLAELLDDDENIYAMNEADLMAKMIINEIYRISQEYKINVTALFRNLQINGGSKKRGFCYHYVSDLLKVLDERRWSYFDLHWGEANAKTFLENNALIVTAKGKPFKSGIAIDSWRTAGKPFWQKVSKDKFLWKEAPSTNY